VAQVFEVFWTFALKIENFGAYLEGVCSFVVKDGSWAFLHTFDVRCISGLFTKLYLENG